MAKPRRDGQHTRRRTGRAVIRRALYVKPRRAARWRAEAGAGSLGLSAHVFVDETKQRGFLLVANVVVPSDLDSVRRILRGLVLPGQRRLRSLDA